MLGDTADRSLERLDVKPVFTLMVTDLFSYVRQLSVYCFFHARPPSSAAASDLAFCFHFSETILSCTGRGVQECEPSFHSAFAASSASGRTAHYVVFLLDVKNFL